VYSNFYCITIEFHADWRAYYSPDGPKIRGISAGLFEDQECFVGRAKIFSFNSQLAPGSLFIENTTSYSAGFYMEYGYKEHRVDRSVKYYATEPECNYKWVESSYGNDVKNAIEFYDRDERFYVGRISTDQGVLVGKVSNKWKKIHYGKGIESFAYEVLICNPKKEFNREDLFVSDSVLMSSGSIASFSVLLSIAGVLISLFFN
jgi:hypothetical protein